MSLTHTDSDTHRLTHTHTHRPHRLSGAMAPTVSSPVLVKSCCTFLPKTRSASGYNLPGDGLAILAGYGCVCVWWNWGRPSPVSPHPHIPRSPNSCACVDSVTHLLLSCRSLRASVPWGQDSLAEDRLKYRCWHRWCLKKPDRHSALDKTLEE